VPGAHCAWSGYDLEVPPGNRWNRLRYTAWAPLYDVVIGFRRQRRESIAALALSPRARVLVVGAGTGLDLPWLPEDARVLATDLTPAMLRRARPRLRPGYALTVMDGHRLALRDAGLDAVVLHLILAVIPDPVLCLREAARVVKPGGRLSVFDKFLPDGGAASWPRRAAGVVAELVATSINRRLGDIVAAAGVGLVVERDEPAAFGSFFRSVTLRRPA
jgi:phosphatidylethanolamine/phosphatidyl-N-methylethanolamine N-methyltransferase